MNVLSVGLNKHTVLDYLPDTFLLIDDGPLIDLIDFPPRKAVTHFDVSTHSFNPLKGVDYRRAREFINVLDAIFPEGENTLTKSNGNFQILEALLHKPKTLDGLIASSKDTQYAHQKIQTLLLSPLLKDVLTKPTNMSFKGTILARLDRALLGEFDAFVLGNLLISQYSGTVVIPDFGFYAHKGHSALLHQNRLIAGINSFEEVPELKQQLLLVDTKIGSHSTADDAEVLALYAGETPGTNGYNTFIQNCIA